MDNVESTGDALAAEISKQLEMSAKVVAIDLRALAGMNTSTKTFYAGMNEKIVHLVNAADKVEAHATDAKRFSTDMEALLQKARRLEALVDRLDEYTSRQEAALSKK